METKQSLLLSPLSRVRRNHALEHATLQILAKTHGHLRLAGYSTPLGFWVIGNIDLDDLQAALNQAVARLNQGERQLAVHPNCGTNFAVSGLFAGTAAWLAMLGSGSSLRSKLERLPLVTTLVTLALIFAQPLGPAIQERVTTDPNLRGLHVKQVDCLERGGVKMIRILTEE